MITAQECKQIRESLTFTSGNGQKHKLKIGKKFVSTTELGDISISKSTKLSKVKILIKYFQPETMYTATDKPYELTQEKC